MIPLVNGRVSECCVASVYSLRYGIYQGTVKIGMS
jgi:hypothetical protein